VRVEQFAVIGSPETGDSGGDEQEGGDGTATRSASARAEARAGRAAPERLSGTP
jgi:hypothetical protein